MSENFIEFLPDTESYQEFHLYFGLLKNFPNLRLEQSSNKLFLNEKLALAQLKEAVLIQSPFLTIMILSGKYSLYNIISKFAKLTISSFLNPWTPLLPRVKREAREVLAHLPPRAERDVRGIFLNLAPRANQKVEVV